MAWITLDTGFLRHHKVAELPSPAAVLGWLAVLLEAKLQRPPGRYHSRRHLMEAVPTARRYLDAYLGAGLLDDQEGELLVHDWASYQRDPTNADRQAAYRHRHPVVTSNGDVTDEVTVPPRASALSVSLSMSNPTNGEIPQEDGSVPGSDEGDVLSDYRDLTLRYPTRPGLRDWLQRLATDYGRSETSAALAVEWAASPDPSDLLSRTEARLAAAVDASRRKRERAASARQSARFEVLG